MENNVILGISITIQLTSDNSNLEGKSKRVWCYEESELLRVKLVMTRREIDFGELAGGLSYREFDNKLIVNKLIVR